MTTKQEFYGKNYSIVECVNGQFVLIHPVSENETFDTFNELVESHPICEEARQFFFGTATTTITADYEHNCETWWDAARLEAKGNPPPSCVGLLDWTNSITVPSEDAAEFIEWASKIKGWQESPFVIQENN